MTQTDVLSRRDLVEIVECASSIDERLSEQFIPDDGADAAVMDERLMAWCQSVGGGDWDRLERRLAWDGLDLERVRPVLGRVQVRDPATLPEWAELLAEALRLSPVPGPDGQDPARPAAARFIDTENPQPFEEILAPFVLVAAQRLTARTTAGGELLSEAAHVALERTLLQTLSFVAGDVLLSRFESMRAQEPLPFTRRALRPGPTVSPGRGTPDFPCREGRSWGGPGEDAAAESWSSGKELDHRPRRRSTDMPLSFEMIASALLFLPTVLGW